MRAWLVLVVCSCGRIDFAALPVASDAPATNSDVGADATSPVANVAFVTSVQVTPSTLGSLAAADAICMGRAASRQLPGNFVAYLSSSTVDAQTRLGSARGWQRLDGRVVADTVSDLANGNITYPIAIDDLGNDIASGPYPNSNLVLTATSGGAYDGSDCAGFQSGAGNVTFGVAGEGHGAWSKRVVQTCTTPGFLYCLQTDHDVQVSPPVVPGRLAFVTAGMFTPSSGISAADALCAAEAMAAGRTGTFLALLPVAGAPAANRFDATKGPWVRSDGVPLADSGDALLGAGGLVLLDRTAQDAVVDDYTITGNDAPSFFTAGEDCSAWTSTTSGNNWGYTAGAGGWMFNETTADCTTPHPIYCLEL